ncbi:MAG: hypothetical protein N2594_03110 [Clostridiales bacterium]|nr:hypothetical protein [Clostridiales bacterium]
MTYFIVFQNKTFEQESKGGFLWAPRSNKEGRRFFHWDNMKEIKKGDLIFHSYRGKIAAISIAKTNCKEEDKPDALQNQIIWEKEGYYAETEYILLDKTILTSQHLDKINELQPKGYSPFNNRGGNTGYLFVSNEELSKYLLDEIIKVQTDRNIIDKLEEIKQKYSLQ